MMLRSCTYKLQWLAFALSRIHDPNKREHARERAFQGCRRRSSRRSDTTKKEKKTFKRAKRSSFKIEASEAEGASCLAKIDTVMSLSI